ncbi:MAG TPA: histidine kinase [Jiangellaceae bacterium]
MFLVLALFAFIPFDGVAPAPWVTALLITQALAVVVVRRRWPIVGLAVAVALFVVALGLGVANPSPSLPVAVAVFTVALERQRRVAVIAVTSTALVLVVATWLFGPSEVLDPRVISLATLVAAAGALGDAARSRRDYIVAITERALRAERTRETEAQHRVAEDRLRIARDLHDVVAHQISVINLHAGVASSALKTRPADAEESLRTIRDASRAVLAEIGDLLAMLRTNAGPGPAAELAPIAGLDRLEDLVAGFVNVGFTVTTQIQGSLVDIRPAVDVVAYRVVQEGLTNAHKHGSGTTATLTIQRTPHTLCLRISNPRTPEQHLAGSPSGYGLHGVRERVESVRGTTSVDTSDPSQFTLEVRLPLQGDTSSTAVSR